ncbi:hypothetical protein G6M50_38170 [Agrobacterium rhizogenes]|nr:hypothetical protein [Rhizobium rhizogenes]NTJ83615.1 hypothetical protein [Rhizobium rhizogenes]
MANGRIVSVSHYGPNLSRTPAEKTVVASPILKLPGSTTEKIKKREAKLAEKKAAQKEASVAKFKRMLKGGRILRAKPPV